MTGRRMHIAIQWHLIGGGSVLRCKCGEWESNPTQAVHVQRASHRAHRVQRGETVAPPRPTPVERAASEERRRWVEWLQATGYPFAWYTTTPPPCTPEDLAVVWREREPGGADQLVDKWADTIREEARWHSGEAS